METMQLLNILNINCTLEFDKVGFYLPFSGKPEAVETSLRRPCSPKSPPEETGKEMTGSDSTQDIVTLNTNNNSSVTSTCDPRYAALDSISQSSFSLNVSDFSYTQAQYRTQPGLIQRRRSANKPRERRQLRHTRLTQLKTHVPKDNHPSLETWIEKNMNRYLQAPDADQNINHKNLTLTTAKSSWCFENAAGTKPYESNAKHTPGPSTSDVTDPRAATDQPVSLVHSAGEVPSQYEQHGSLPEMLDQLSRYRSVADVPHGLKERLSEIVCKPIVGQNYSDDESVLSRLRLICDSHNAQNSTRNPSDLQALVSKDQNIPTSDKIMGQARNIIPPSGQPTESIKPCTCSSKSVTKTETNNETTLGTDAPLSSDYVFKNVFGPFFVREHSYWLIRPPVLPTHLFKYRTHDDGATVVIGTGTFGEVVAATMNVKGRIQRIVLKEPFADFVTKDQVFDEAKITMYLEPTGYVPVCYGLVQDCQGSPSIVLELFGSGTTLKGIFSQGGLARLHWLSIARQLAEGLSRIHSMDILINDIKADNVLVDLSKGSPVVKYCDMGCSSYKTGITFDDTNMDLFSHLAPEVRAGGQTSKASDVYGLGKLLDRTVQVSLVSGIVSVTVQCLRLKQDERVTAQVALTLLNGLQEQEERYKTEQSSCDMEQSSSDSSLNGYIPDSGVSSEESPAHTDNTQGHKAPVQDRLDVGKDLYNVLKRDAYQAQDDVYEKLTSVGGVDGICLAFFVLLFVVLLFWGQKE